MMLEMFAEKQANGTYVSSQREHEGEGEPVQRNKKYRIYNVNHTE